MSNGGGIITQSERGARALERALAAFVTEHFHTQECDIREDPHILAFIEYLVERPVRRRHIDGAPLEGPLRRTLGTRIRDLADRYRQTGRSCPITRRSIAYADSLVTRYAPTPRRAFPASYEVVRDLVGAIDTKTPIGKRNKACLLGMWETWARPSEILRRRYPEEVRAGYDAGIVIVVPQSKTNNGPEPEYFAIPHRSQKTMCAVCAIRSWLDCLGEGYRGPLFPGMARRSGMAPSGTPLSTDDFQYQLKKLADRAGYARRRFTTYSLRRGRATMAARRGWPLSDIQAGLRHGRFVQSLEYIDPEALFDLMKLVAN